MAAKYEAPRGDYPGGLGAMTDAWRNALNLMKTALNALDEAEAPPHLRAQLDHVICQLEKTLTKQKKEPTRPRQAANQGNAQI